MFQVGDKVKVVDYPHDDFTPIGEEGIIVSISTYHYVRFTNVVQGRVSALFCEDELEHVKSRPIRYKKYNRHSDTICEVMENKFIGGWFSTLRDKGVIGNWNNQVLWNDLHDIHDKDMKETLFGFMHVVDDETLDAIIKELCS